MLILIGWQFQVRQPSDYIMNKAEFYADLNRDFNALMAGETSFLATLANTSALLYERLTDVNWAGFYLLYVSTLRAGVIFTVLNPAQRVLILTATHAVSWTSNMSSMLASSLKKRKRVFRHSVLNSKRKNAKLPQLLVRKKTHRAANASHARPRHAAKKALNVNLVRKSR